MWQDFTDWLGSSGLKVAAILLIVYITVRFGSLIVAQLVRRSLKKDQFATKADEKKRENTLISIIGTTMTVVIWILAGLIMLNELGVNIGPLIAGASVAGVAIGFGAQSLIKDFVSGIFIIMENQYRVGDVIKIAGVSGKVEAITIRTTVLRDLAGNLHHVPNGSIDVSTNMTMEWARINMDIGIAYDSDIKKVEKIVNKVGTDLANDKDWSEYILEAPQFRRIDTFGDSAVYVKILGKVMPAKQWSVAGEFRKRLKAAFDKEKIVIPFQQRVIHKK